MSALRNFLDLSDAGRDAIAAILEEALERKTRRQGWPKGKPEPDAPLAGRVLAMLFEKSSTRTRVSFDIAMRQLGGSTIVLDAGTSQLGRGESIADTARVLSRMVDVIMIRTGDHSRVDEMAQHAEVPVINGLTDVSHPCQIIADLLTLVEHHKCLTGLKVTWLGDCNNVLNSFIEASGLMQFELRIGTPKDVLPNPQFINPARARGGSITITDNPFDAALGADAIITDCWTSMGQEPLPSKLHALAPFQVDTALMDHAKSNAIFLHCLPAHLGDEVTKEVFESTQSAVFDEAENRVHAQKAILLWLLGLVPSAPKHCNS